jgi:hypothetical protein
MPRIKNVQFPPPTPPQPSPAQEKVVEVNIPTIPIEQVFSTRLSW